MTELYGLVEDERQISVRHTEFWLGDMSDRMTLRQFQSLRHIPGRIRSIHASAVSLQKFDWNAHQVVALPPPSVCRFIIYLFSPPIIWRLVSSSG